MHKFATNLNQASATNGTSALYTFYHHNANRNNKEERSLPKIQHAMSTANNFGVLTSVLDQEPSFYVPA